MSNMARYIGAAVATALAASIYSSVIARQTAAGAQPAEALSAGLGTASWVMAVFSAAGVLMAVVMGRHRPPQGTLQDAAASAAAVSQTLPTTATGTPNPRRRVPAARWRDADDRPAQPERTGTFHCRGLRRADDSAAACRP